MMTKEQHDRLQKFSFQFNTAIKSHFVRMSEGEFTEMTSVYQEYSGKVVSKAERNCGNCRLKLIQQIGRDFMNYEIWYEQKYGNRKKNAEDLNPAE